MYDFLLSIGDDKMIINAILIYLVMSKIDPFIKPNWEKQFDSEKFPLLSNFESGLNRRYQHIAADDSSSLRPTYFHKLRKLDLFIEV